MLSTLVQLTWPYRGTNLLSENKRIYDSESDLETA